MTRLARALRVSTAGIGKVKNESSNPEASAADLALGAVV